jgi:hypothetical protein
MATTFYVPGDNTEGWIGNNARMCLKVEATGTRTNNTTM